MDELPNRDKLLDMYTDLKDRESRLAEQEADARIQQAVVKYSRPDFTINPDDIRDAEDPRVAAAKLLVEHLEAKRDAEQAKAKPKLPPTNGKGSWNPRMSFENADGTPNREALREFERQNRN
jgi:hypothetical protein